MPFDPANFPIAPGCPVKRFLRPGDYLFVNSFQGFFVKAKIIEVQLIVGQGGNISSHWLVIDEETSILSDSQLVSLGDLRKCKIYNQIPWVDFPLGHAAYIDNDGFYTLEDIRHAFIRPSRKGMKRRIRKYLKSCPKRWPNWTIPINPDWKFYV